MKFTCQVEINAPKLKVVELFDNPDNLKEWQDGFVAMEFLEGEPGAVGSTAKMIYKTGKREIELMETILTNNLPDDFEGEYVHKHMTNTMKNTFETLKNGNTLYQADIHYSKFNGLMIKLMASIFPGMFKKQTQKWMDQFKRFVEHRINID